MTKYNETRRNFIRNVAAAGVLTTLSGGAASAWAAPKEKDKNKKKKSDKLQVGIIGTGSRCAEHIKNVMSIGGNEIIAICDIQQAHIDNALQQIAAFGITTKPRVYTGSEYAFKDMLEKETFDVVIIVSPWEWHVPMSTSAMKAGVPYVAVEVSAANTLEECWDLVNVSEETGSQLFIMENVCYRQDVMACLNMVRQGLFGELIHARCGYEHDLRDVKFNNGSNFYYRKGDDLKMGADAANEAQWRTNHSLLRNGDLYPTHGVGPIAEYMNINRGNRFVTLSSMATKSRGLHKYIVDNGGKDHPLSSLSFNCGDIVTTTIGCANGETIIITHDTNSPRPYSLGFRVQGTNGLWLNDGNTIYIEGKSEKPHEWDPAEKWFKKYNHKLWVELEEKARNAGHGGMDYIMMYDLLDAARNNRPSPMDCYDAAAWSAISALSEMSVARGGALVDFPDFTRGQWIKRDSKFAL